MKAEIGVIRDSRNSYNPEVKIRVTVTMNNDITIRLSDSDRIITINKNDWLYVCKAIEAMQENN